jgi:hypothetical protein
MTTATEQVIKLTFRGGNKEFATCLDPEVLLEGGAGTGKTYTILTTGHTINLKYPGTKGLIVRKWQVNLTSTCLDTFNNEVLTSADGVKFYGGSKSEAASYRYPNGSRIVVGGMDEPDKVLSSQYDWIYFNECTEGTLDDWEKLTTRLRNGKIRIMQLWGDCNPTFDRSWINLRCLEGLTTRIRTVIEDNPKFFDDEGNATPEGTAYLARLDRLKGSNYTRFRLGEWAGMENAIYTLDRAKHVVPCTVQPHEWGVGAIGVDYGDVHPKAATAVQIGPTGRWWVRECRVTDDDTELEAIVRGMMQRFKITRIRTDPNQAYLAHKLGGKVAKRGPGTRKERIELCKTLYDAEPPTLVYVEGAEGIEDLWTEANLYRWEKRESNTIEELIPVRIAEDRVASKEYACEELREALGQRPLPGSAKVLNSRRATSQGLYSTI